MKITRIDAAPNVDIERGPNDEQAKRGFAIASAMDAAMKAASAIYDVPADAVRVDAEEPTGKEGEDHPGTKIDKILEGLDVIGKRLDSVNSRMDAMEAKSVDGAEAAMVDRKKKDAEIETRRGGDPEGAEEGEPRELKADKKKDGYADSAAIRDELSAIQADADRASSAWNESARTPWNNELPDEYRRRVASPHLKHSTAWRDVNLRELSGVALKNAVGQIFKDSFEMASSNEPWEGGLREIRSVNRDTGHISKSYVGSPSAWMNAFKSPARRVKFDMDLIKQSMSKANNK